jgi:putative transposase
MRSSSRATWKLLRWKSGDCGGIWSLLSRSGTCLEDRGHFQQTRSVIYALIGEQPGELPVSRRCQVLRVSPSTYVDWHRRSPIRQQRSNDKMLGAIRREHRISRQTSGSLRIFKALRRQVVEAARHRIARLMLVYGIVGKAPRRKRPVTTRRAEGALAATNVPGQDFSTSQRSEKWVGRCHLHRYGSGLAVHSARVRSVLSLSIVDWSMAPYMPAALVKDAQRTGLGRRCPAPGLLHQSDQGTYNTSSSVRMLLAARGFEVERERCGQLPRQWRHGELHRDAQDRTCQPPLRQLKVKSVKQSSATSRSGTGASASTRR